MYIKKMESKQEVGLYALCYVLFFLLFFIHVLHSVWHKWLFCLCKEWFMKKGLAYSAATCQKKAQEEKGNGAYS